MSRHKFIQYILTHTNHMQQNSRTSFSKDMHLNPKDTAKKSYHRYNHSKYNNEKIYGNFMQNHIRSSPTWDFFWVRRGNNSSNYFLPFYCLQWLSSQFSMAALSLLLSFSFQTLETKGCDQFSWIILADLLPSLLIFLVVRDIPKATRFWLSFFFESKYGNLTKNYKKGITYIRITILLSQGLFHRFSFFCFSFYLFSSLFFSFLIMLGLVIKPKQGPHIYFWFDQNSIFKFNLYST